MRNFNKREYSFEYSHKIVKELIKYQDKIQLLEGGEYRNNLTHMDTKEITKLLYDLGTYPLNDFLDYVDTPLRKRFEEIKRRTIHDDFSDIVISTLMEEDFSINILEGIIKNYLSDPYNIIFPDALTQPMQLIASEEYQNDLHLRKDEIFSKYIYFRNASNFSSYLTKINLQSNYLYHTTGFICKSIFSYTIENDNSNSFHYFLQDFFNVKAGIFMDEIIEILQMEAENYVESKYNHI